MEVLKKCVIFDQKATDELIRFYLQTCDVVSFLRVKNIETGDEQHDQWGNIPPVDVKGLKNTVYDLVVIMQAELFETVRRELIEEGVPDNKIVFGGGFFDLRPNWLIPSVIFNDMEKRGLDTIVDLGFHFAGDNLIAGKGACLTEDHRNCIRIYGCVMDEDLPKPFPVFKNLYNALYQSLEDIPADIREQCLYLGRIAEYMNADERVEFLMMFLDVFDSIYVTIPFPDSLQNRKWLLLRRIPQIKIMEWNTGSGLLLRLERAPGPQSVHIYVAMHKECTVYKSNTYIPLWLAPAQENKYGYAGNDLDKEIAGLNPRINECTGLYWIWKYSNVDVKGMAHYRRYFLSEYDAEQPFMERDEILHLLRRYDVIVTNIYSPMFSVSVHFAGSLNKDVRGHGMRVFERLIAERQPDYLEAFHKVMYGHGFYLCQMMIARKEIFNTYCEWLFSFLLDAAKELDYDHYSDSNHRVSAYMAEYILTVWLMCQDIRIKEVSMGYTG